MRAWSHRVTWPTWHSKVGPMAPSWSGANLWLYCHVLYRSSPCCELLSRSQNEGVLTGSLWGRWDVPGEGWRLTATIFFLHSIQSSTAHAPTGEQCQAPWDCHFKFCQQFCQVLYPGLCYGFKGPCGGFSGSPMLPSCRCIMHGCLCAFLPLWESMILVNSVIYTHIYIWKYKDFTRFWQLVRPSSRMRLKPRHWRVSGGWGHTLTRLFKYSYSWSSV